ncbi:hypothetical protein BKA64DRAFT_744850 [Cadophora sp. MPI-SDFR-AT-0126]|nr:hypothetical protein BKA64DRAFT_744850 [Leotiomycetes sp. MPI-SDFR-AT-0126]
MKKPDMNDAVTGSDRDQNAPNSPSQAAQDNYISNSIKFFPSTTNHSVQELEAMFPDNTNDNTSDVSLDLIEERLNSLSSAPQFSNTHYAVHAPEASSVNDVDDNTSDVSLEPIDGGLNGLFATTSKSESKSKRKSKKNKNTSTPTSGNALYTMLKGMAAGRSAPPIQNGDTSVLARTFGLWASIQIPENTTAQLEPAHKNSNESLVNYASGLVASFPVSSSAGGTIQEQGKINGANGINKSSVSYYLRKMIGGLPTPPSKSENKARKKLPMFRKMKGKSKSQKKSANEVDDMDNDELLRYALEQSAIDFAMEESLLDLGAQNNDVMDTEEMAHPSNGPSAEGENAEDLVNGQFMTASTPKLSGLPLINDTSKTGLGRPDALTLSHATFAGDSATNTISETTANKKQYSNKFEDKEGFSKDSTATDNMDIDASAPAMAHNSPLAVKESSNNFDTASSNAILLHENAQAAPSLVPEDEFAIAAHNAAQLHNNLALTSPTSMTLSSPPTSAPQTNPNIPHPLFKFTSLPFTVRNAIYKLLVLSPRSYATTSPRNRRQRRTEPHKPSAHTSIFLVNKLISTESRTIFYTYNVFAVGNGRWGSRTEANLHGLMEFVRLVPGMFVKMAKLLEMKIKVPGNWLDVKLEGDDRDFEELRMQETTVGLGDLLREEFSGVERIGVTFTTPEKEMRGWGTRSYRMVPSIAVIREEKLFALHGLINFPYLRYLDLDETGSLEVLVAFEGIARMILDKNKAEGRLDNERGDEAQGTKAFTKEQAQIEGEMSKESKITEDGKQVSKTQFMEGVVKEDDYELSAKNFGYSEESCEVDMLDTDWENPFKYHGGEGDSVFDEEMVDARSDTGGDFGAFGIED